MADEELIGFIRESVRSVWAMELLLLLSRDKTRNWQPVELVRELRANQTLVQANLAIFQRNGLAVSDEMGWHFAPANEKLQELVDRLALAFRERPVATMTLVTHIDPLQTLSDAFRLRED
ncbi:MAG TPA: hypothetical protein VJ798_00365 [Rhizomicrobium sp.]|nr:hypothetical protein [Rhizomicrobium sp.]